MLSKNILKLICSLVLGTFLGCSTGSQKSTSTADTIKSSTKTDTVFNEEKEEDFRQEFIALYQQPVFIDTVLSGNAKPYELLFHHYCTMDSKLVVPAKYNFDINKDFVTHNFVSDIVVLSDKDTVFKKHISKSDFNKLIDSIPPLRKYAALLYPALVIRNDSIYIHYSISIPVTDVGIEAEIRFDKKGNYVIVQ